MVGYDKSKENVSQFDIIFAGAASGFVTRMICQPFDVLKIRFQLQVEPISKTNVSKYHSLFHAINLIVKEEGVKALWKGHIPAQLLSMSYGVGQFWTFEKLTKEASKLNLPGGLAPVVNFLCGSGAGTTATVLTFPFDVVRTRLVAQSERCKIYPGVSQAFRSILKHEGFFALYRGILPAVIQIAPHGGVQFMTYKMCNNIYKYLTNSPRTTLLSSLLSGSLAGLCAKSLVYPLDLAKKRLQIQGFEDGRMNFGQFFTCGGLYDCLARIYRIEGFYGLFKGLTPSIMKAVVTTAFYFSSYEMISQFMQGRKN